MQARRRIKLFALKFIAEFYFQNNKAPKEAEAVVNVKLALLLTAFTIFKKLCCSAFALPIFSAISIFLIGLN